jgi:hypothetical protein
VKSTDRNLRVEGHIEGKTRSAFGPRVSMIRR